MHLYVNVSEAKMKQSEVFLEQVSKLEAEFGFPSLLKNQGLFC